MVSRGFFAKEVCDVLGHTNPSKAVDDHVDAEDKQNVSLGLPGRAPLVVNESGLYALIFGSKTPESKRFKDWVTSKVLPSIRKTGSYVAPGQEEPKRSDR
jgi:prophage antirepressor-like protein